MKREWLRNLLALAVLGGLVVFVSLGRKKAFEEGEKADQEKKLAQIAWENVDRIAITNSIGRVMFELRPKDAHGNFTDAWKVYSQEFEPVSTWLVKEPYVGLADHYAVKTLIENLKDLTSTKVVDETSARPEEYNLKTPPVVADLFEKGKDTPALTVRVGDDNPAHSGLYVQTSANSKIFLTSMTLEYLKNRKAIEWRSKEILGFKDPKNVTRIEARYVDAGKTRALTARHDGDDWKLSGGSPLPADGRAVEDFLNDVKSMRFNDVVSEAADTDAKKFGLDRPYATIKVTVGKDKEAVEKTLLIGSRIEPKKDIYVRRADFPLIFAVAPATKTTLTKTVADWVEKKPFTMAAGDPDTVTATKVTGAVELAQEEGVWRLKKPVTDVADASGVRSLLAKLKELKAKDYLPPEKLKPGKEKPWVTVKLTQGKNSRQTSFYLVHGGKSVEGRWLEPGLTYRFEKVDVDAIITALEDLREKRLMPFDTSEAATLEVKKGKLDGKFERKAPEEWRATRLVGVEGELAKKLSSKDTIDSILRGIETLRLTGFVENFKEPLKEEGLHFTVTPKTGAAATWVVGSAVEGKRLVWSKERRVAGEVPERDIEEVEKLLRSDTKPKG